VITKYKIDFDKAGTNDERAEILRALLLYIAKRMGLETTSRKLIDVKFSDLGYGVGGIFLESDKSAVYLSTYYTIEGTDIQEAVGVYLHECAHFIVYNFAHYKSQHCFLFYAFNLAINIKFDAFVKSVSCLDYRWMNATLKLYNMHEDQGYIDPALIDYEAFSERLGEATRIAFKFAQNNENSVYFICGQIHGHYQKKLAKERKAKVKAKRFKELLEIGLTRAAAVAALAVGLKMVFF
jgi:hypothetical protein